MKPHDTKRQVTTPKKNDIEARLNQSPNIHISRRNPVKQMGRLQNNPSIGWVHPKSTHARPLAWGNKKKEKVIRLIKFNFDV